MYNNVQLVQLLHEEEGRLRIRKRRFWARQWLLDRPLYGQYEIPTDNLAASCDAEEELF